MTDGVGGSTAEAELAAITSARDAIPPIGVEERHQRIAAARARMVELGIDALWLDGTTNLEYFTGVRHGQSERMIGAVLPARGDIAYLCPAFEAEKLKTLLTVGERIEGWQEDESPYALMVDLLRSLGVDRGTVALDDHARFFVVDGIRAASEAAQAHHRLVPSTAVASHLRQRKSDHEIALLRHAMEQTVRIQAAAARILAPGITTAQVAAFLAAAHQRAGFDRGPLFSLVLFGAASAYPHGVDHVQTLEDGDMVLIDVGAPMHGYVSDITRSYVFGTPSDRQRQIWDLEKQAMLAGFAAAQVGAPAHAIDDAARGVIEAAGFGPGYRVPGLPHRTGHGVGMDVHEAPYFVKGDTTVLAPGMCGSVEPTLCLYGEFGCRLEDHVVVTEQGPMWLTQPPLSVDDPFGAVA